MCSSFRHDPDRALVEACQDLNSDAFEPAFEALYHRYKDHVYNVAYRITGNAADALDVAQETFGLLLRKVGGFQFASRFSSWLYRIVVNLSINSRRRTLSKPEVERAARTGGVPAGQLPVQEVRDERTASPEDTLASMELHAAVQTAIGLLSPKLRVVVVLRYLQGLSYEALAETLEVSIGTVKSRLARAHIALERIFGSSLDRFGLDLPKAHAQHGAEGGVAHPAEHDRVEPGREGVA